MSDTLPATLDSDARISRILRFTVGVLILAYGAFIHDRESTFWAVMSLALFTLPLLLQATPWVTIRMYALWGGVLLVAQSLLSPLIRSDYVSLPPHLKSSVDVRTSEGPGMKPGLRQITTDAFGYRVHPAVDYFNRTRTRIFAIGGSTTEDIMLDDRATWTHLLQEHLKTRGHAVEIINTGVSGLRARNHLATFKQVLRHQPDIAIILVGANDWNKHIRDQFESERDAYKPANLRASALGKLLGRFVVAPLRVRLTGVTSSDQHVVIDQPDAFNADKPKRSLERPIKHYWRPGGVAEDYRASMEALAQACTTAKVLCLWLTQPHAYHEQATQALRDLYWMTPPYAQYTLDMGSMLHITSLYNRFLLGHALRHGQASCNIAPGLEASNRLFFDDMHYTDEGAQRVAQMVLPCLEGMLTLSQRPDR